MEDNHVSPTDLETRLKAVEAFAFGVALFAAAVAIRQFFYIDKAEFEDVPFWSFDIRRFTAYAFPMLLSMPVMTIAVVAFDTALAYAMGFSVFRSISLTKPGRFLQKRYSFSLGGYIMGLMSALSWVILELIASYVEFIKS